MLKFRDLSPFALVCCVSACASVESPTSQIDDIATKNEFVRITDRAQFVALLDGKTFRADQSWWEVTADGGMRGATKAGKLVGSWEWDDGAWCREYTAGEKTKPLECQYVYVSGDLFKFVKDRGAGEESIQQASSG